MSLRIEFFVHGDPKGQPRARAAFRRIGNKIMPRVFNPDTAEGWKSLIAVAVPRQAIDNAIRKPVRVSMVLFFKRPKAHFRSNGQLKDSAPRFYEPKPDNDNLEKAAWDALVNLRVIADDRFIVANDTIKLYGDRPGAHIVITELADR